MEAPEKLSIGDVSSRSVGAEAASHFVRSVESHKVADTRFDGRGGGDGGGDGGGREKQKHRGPHHSPQEASTCATQAFLALAPCS